MIKSWTAGGGAVRTCKQFVCICTANFARTGVISLTFEVRTCVEHEDSSSEVCLKVQNSFQGSGLIRDKLGSDHGNILADLGPHREFKTHVSAGFHWIGKFTVSLTDNNRKPSTPFSSCFLMLCTQHECVYLLYICYGDLKLFTYPWGHYFNFRTINIK